MPLIFSTSGHLHDRDLLLSQQDRDRIAEERRAQMLLVTSRGDVSPERARDIAIAEAVHSSNGLGCSESLLFDEIDAATRAGLTNAEPDPLGPFFVSNSVPAQLGRMWDAIRNLWRALLAYLGQPSPFN